MDTEYEDLFKNIIVAPLQQVVGRPLRAANYYIIWGEFDPDLPNEHGGCQGVHLVFDGGEIEFDWAWEKPFVGNGIAYHLSIPSHSARRERVREWSEADVSGLNLIAATDTRLWRSLIGESLVGVEVMGDPLDAVRCSPQAVLLHFPAATVAVAIGMTGAEDRPVTCVGDGDEVLLFSEREWAGLPDQGVRGTETLIRCWHWPN